MKLFPKQTVLILIVCIISIFLIWYMQNVQRIKPFFASYDPYYHYAVTTQYADSWLYSDTITSSAKGTKIMYTSLLHHATLSFATLTNIPIKDVFYYWWWLLLIASFLMAVVVWKNIAWTYAVWVLSWCLRLISYYVLLRHSMFLPENIALLLLLFFLLQLQKKQYGIALFILFVYGYVHYRSRYIPLWSYFLLHLITVLKTKNYKSFLFYSLLWIGVVLIAYPINIEFIDSVLYIVYWYLWLIPHWWDIAPNKELYALPTVSSFLNQYWAIVWNILLITLFTQWIYTLKNYKKSDVFQVMVVSLFTVLLIAYFSPFIAKSIPTYRFAPYILLFGILSLSFHFTTMKYWKVSMLILACTLFSGFSMFYTQYWRTWITKSDAAAINLVNSEYSGSVAISLWAPLFTMMHNAEWDPEFISRVLYVQSEAQLLSLLEARYWMGKTITIIASTNQMKARQKTPLPVYAILQQYRIVQDDTEYTEVYTIDLSKRLD